MSVATPSKERKQNRIFCSAAASDHRGRRKRKTNRAGQAPVGRAGTWMVLTMRPDRRKSRPSGRTTSTSGTAMAPRRRRRRFRSRRGRSDERRQWNSSPRRSFSGDRWLGGGGRWRAAPPATRTTGHARRIRRFFIVGRRWMDERWEEGRDGGGGGVKRMDASMGGIGMAAREDGVPVPRRTTHFLCFG